MASFMELSPMGSNYKDSQVVLQSPTNPTNPTKSSGSSSGSSSSFSGIEDPAAREALMKLIAELAAGGGVDRQNQRNQRNQQIESARSLMGDYSKQAAFTDAADLMAQQLQKSLEANMPAISRSIQGAGTSAGSMQGLLSQKLATESAQAAGALGAEQAKAYGSISTQLQGVLEALTRIDPSLEQNLINALSLTKIDRSQSQQQSFQQSYGGGGGGGGGSYLANRGNQMPSFNNNSGFGGNTTSNYQPSVSDNEAMYWSGDSYSNSGGGSVMFDSQGNEIPSGSGYIVNSSGQGSTFNGGGYDSSFYSPEYDTGGGSNDFGQIYGGSSDAGGSYSYYGDPYSSYNSSAGSSSYDPWAESDYFEYDQ